MRAYSQDLRDRVLHAIERGDSPSAIARRLEVSRMWVYQVQRRWLNEGCCSSYPMGGHRKSCIAHLQETICGWLEAEPDLTLWQLCERLQEQQDIQIKTTGLWNQLNKWGMSFKKNTARQRTATRGRATSAKSLAAGVATLGATKAGVPG